MKKILMAAAIVCVAACAQAAAINWAASSYNYVTSAGVTQTAATADTGTFVLCYLGNGTADWSAATVVNEGSVAYGTAKGGAAYARASGAYSFTYGGTGAPVNGDIFGVMFKAEDGTLSQLQTVAGDAIANTFTISGMSSNTYAGTLTFASSNYTTAVPEPTSGLLLLLGMAGLALKRKIA